MSEVATPTCRLCLAADPLKSYYLLSEHPDIQHFQTSLGLHSNFTDPNLNPAHVCDDCNMVIKRFLNLKKIAVENEKAILKIENQNRPEKTPAIKTFENEENFDIEVKLECKEVTNVDVDLNQDYFDPEDVKQFEVCNICGKTCHTKKILRSHMLTHTSEMVKCPKCVPEKFLKEYNINRHMKNTHKEKDVPCEFVGCDKMFKQTLVMKRHIKMVHMEERSVCSLCGETVYNLHYHMQTCNQDNREKVTCQVCKKTLSCKVSLNTHMAGVHGPQNLTPCSVCGKTVKNMTSHVKLSHTSDRQFTVPCQVEECDKKFSTKQVATLHYSRVHMGIKEQCKICLDWLKNLPMHMSQVHKQGTKHVCSECGKIFYKSSDLKVHIERVHQGKRYICPECGKSVSKIHEHMKVVHDVPEFDKNAIAISYVTNASDSGTQTFTFQSQTSSSEISQKQAEHFQLQNLQLTSQYQ